MRPFVVKNQPSLRGEISLLGDKAITHRAVILSCLARGNTRIKNFPDNDDCQATISAFRSLGVKAKKEKGTLNISGVGLCGLFKPKSPIFINESGTTFRLLLGILAGQDFKTKLLAGKSLSKRPMLRVILPLRLMGAVIHGQTGKRANGQREEYPPISIKGGNLKPIAYKMPLASAQVKSAILLAGLYAEGRTSVSEPIKTRDHTERMLKLFKADIKVSGNKIVLKGKKNLLSPKIIYVPGDISSAAFFMVLATLIPESKIIIRNVSLNPTRIGVLKVLKRMGANITVKAKESKIKGIEPIGDLIVRSVSLKGTIVSKEEIPSLIDELPVLMVAASLAQGTTIFNNAGELRVKETDRIRSMLLNLKKMGADIKVLRTGRSENIVVHGKEKLTGAKVMSFGDHRTAMSMVVAGMAAVGKTLVDDISCIKKSFPEFVSVLRSLTD